MLVSGDALAALEQAKLTISNIDHARCPDRKPQLMSQANKCGSCRLCCTVLRVEKFVPPIEDKPARVPCQFICSTGCQIYETRPGPCEGFECVWLASQRWPELALPSQERPDRTNVVMEVNSKQTLIVHCKTPEAWRDPRVIKRIEKMLAGNAEHCTIDHDGERVSLYEHGRLTSMRYIGDDPVTGETKYIRAR